MTTIQSSQDLYTAALLPLALYDQKILIIIKSEKELPQVNRT